METAIKIEITRLLDRLYNFKGNNSEIISQVVREISESAAEKDSLIAKAEENKMALAEISHKKEQLEKEYNYFERVIGPIEGESLATIFSELGISLNFNSIKEQVQAKFPETQEALEARVDFLNNEITDCSSQIQSIEDHKAEIEIRKMEAVKNQKSLVELLEKIFNGNEDISKQSIKSLLKLFRFTDEECDELAKVLLFPEDTLFVYDRIQNQAPGKSVVEIVRGAKEAALGELEAPDLKHTEKVFTFDFEEKKQSAQTSPEIKKDVSLNSIYNYENYFGLDIDRFSGEQIVTIEELPNKEIILTNIEVMNNINQSPYEQFNLLVDINLKYKVQQLLDLNKSYADIGACHQVLAIDVNKMQGYFDLLRSNDYELRKIPLLVYVYGPEKFIENINILNNNGYNIDDKQIYNNATALLLEPVNVTENLRLIKDYSINITNSEGKIDLALLAIPAKTLETNALKYIEAGVEYIIDQDPRYLIYDADEVIARIDFCKKSGIPYQTNGLNTNYLSYIFRQNEFEQVLQKKIDLNPYLPQETNINGFLFNELPQGKDIINYINGGSFGVEGLSSSPEQINLYAKSIESIADQTKRAYIINGVYFAKPRVINNIKKLDININSTMLDNHDALILAALFINSNKKEDDYYQVKSKADHPETFGGRGL